MKRVRHHQQGDSPHKRQKTSADGHDHGEHQLPESLDEGRRDHGSRRHHKKAIPVGKEMDLPWYKGIQLPHHLKWVTVQTKPTESVLMQEIHALDLEVKRLKQVKAIHKEYRRYTQMPIGLMSKPCACCHGWNKRKHPCSHEFCEKPCKRHEDEQQRVLQKEQLQQKEEQRTVVARPSKEVVVQQQIRNVYLQTMQKISQMNQLYQQQQSVFQAQIHSSGEPNSGAPGMPVDMALQIEGLGIQVVDERNKRGRPPKKPKAPEVEQREKEILRQKIMLQVQQGLKNQQQPQQQQQPAHPPQPGAL